jgi:hypothetical protein
MAVPAPLRCAVERAHMFGAEAVILARCVNSSPDQIDAVRRRYFRELEAIDLMLGIYPSPFSSLT